MTSATLTVDGRTLTGRILVYDVPRPLRVGAESFSAGCFGDLTTTGRVPVVDGTKGEQVVLARSTRLHDRAGELWGEWQINPGPKGDAFIADVRNGCVVALDPAMRVLDQRSAVGGVRVTSALLHCVRPTALDVWPDRRELVEVRSALILERYGITPPPVVDLSPIPAPPRS